MATIKLTVEVEASGKTPYTLDELHELAQRVKYDLDTTQRNLGITELRLVGADASAGYLRLIGQAEI